MYNQKSKKFNITNRPQEFYGHGKNIINVIMKVQIIIITDSKVIDKIGACNVKSRNLYEKIKLKIDVYQSTYEMHWEIRVVPRSSEIYWGGGVVWINRESEPLTESPLLYVGNIKIINHCY